MLTRKRRGQGLVEFALILPILLLVVLGIAETALVIQGHLTVQHAAREAARFATTYQPPQGACFDLDGDNNIEDGMSQSDDDDLAPWPYCPKYRAADITEKEEDYHRRRVALIRNRAREAATGLRISDTASSDEPGFFHVRVRGYPKVVEGYCSDPDIGYEPWDPADEHPGCLGHPGLEGVPVEVYIQHNVEILDPLYRQIFSQVRVSAEAEMENEGQQVGVEGEFSLDTDPDPPDVTEPTVPPTDPPPPEPTDPPPDVSIDLDPADATNVLPYTPTHQFVATVLDADSQPLEGAPVSFSIDEADVGGFNASGTQKYAEGVTDAQGETSVTVYGHESGSATIRAWVDNDGDDTWDGAPSEPSDASNKTWTTGAEPYITASDYDVFAEDVIQVDVMDHAPNTSYQLFWCVVSGEPTSQVVPVVTDGSGSASLDTYKIPADSSGQYRLETHPDGGGGCGANDLVARSTEIHVEVARPDLSISILEPTPPCPETDFTVSVVVENHTAGSTDLTFDVDLYVDPGSPEGGILPKQWISGIDSHETVTLTFVAWVGSFGVHATQAQVDASDVVEEEQDWSNWDTLRFSTANESTCAEGDDPPPWGPGPCQPPGSRECESLLEYGGFEGNVDNVFTHWHVTDGRRPSFKPYEGSSSMRLHASLGSYHPQCPVLNPELYQTVTIPDLTGGCTETMRTTLVVQGQRMVGDSEFACSVRGAVDADDELHVQLRTPMGDPSHFITRGAPRAAAPSSEAYAALPPEAVPASLNGLLQMEALRSAAAVETRRSPPMMENASAGNPLLPAWMADHDARVMSQKWSSVAAPSEQERGSRKGLLMPATLLPEPRVSAQPDVIHSASFESDLDGWTVTDGAAVAGRNCYYSGAEGSDCYARGKDWGSASPDPTVHRTISTIGYSSIHVSYWRADLDCEGDERFIAEYSPDGGVTWTELQSAAPTGAQGSDPLDWRQENFDLPDVAERNAAFTLRFTFDAGDWDDYMTVDSVVVTGVPRRVDFSVSEYSVSESAGTAEITVELNRASDDTITVDYATSDGSATAGEDYAAASGTLTFVPDDTEESFTVGILSDEVYEGDETVDLRLSNPSGASIGPNDPAILTINEDETLPEVNLSSPSYSVTEDAGTAIITATLGSTPAETLMVAYDLSGGTATLSDDYEYPAADKFVFPGGETVASVQIPIIDDALIEDDETVGLTLLRSQDWLEAFDLSDGTQSDGGATAWSVDTSALGSGAIFEVRDGTFMASDTDGTGSTAGDAEGIWASEVIDIDGAGPVDVSVDIWSEGSADSSDYIEVYYRIDGGNEVFVDGENDDFSRRTASISDLSGSTVQVIVRTSLNYDDESYHWDDVMVTNGTGPHSVGPNGSATLTIVDDDVPVTVDFSSATYTVTEDVGLATITATLSDEADWTVVAQYASSDETATAGEDYAAVEGTITFDPGETSQTFTVPITDDLMLEDNETLNLTLQSSSVDWVEAFNLSDGTRSDSGATAWTSQYSGAGVFEVQSNAFMAMDTDGEGVWESEAIDIAGGGSIDVSVDISRQGDANSGDYIGVYYKLDGGAEVPIAERTGNFGAQTVTASDLSGSTLQVVVRANLDHDDESYHWDNVTVTNGSGPASIGPNSPATLIIVDNDDEPTVSFSSDNYSVAEGDGTATITATLSAVSGVTATVEYATADGTATAGEDYTSTLGTLIFAPGTVTETFEVPIIDDDQFNEGDETVALSLANPVGAIPDPEGDSATLTITEDDLPAVDFTASEYRVGEDVGRAVITVALNIPFTETVRVDCYTVDGTATAPDDYAAVSDTLTFDPGRQTITFTVAISDDLAYEDDETVDLVLSNPTDALVGPNSPAQLVILDNEPVATFEWEPFSVDFTEDLDVTALGGETVDVAFYGTHDGDEHGTWFYLDNVECEVCTEWPVPEHEAGMASIYGTVEVEGNTRGGLDVWIYDEGADVTYHTVTLDGGDDLFPEGTYHFYNIPPGTYTVYSESWQGGLLFWDLREATVGANGEQRVDLHLTW
jgi:hypothetical protein